MKRNNTGILFLTGQDLNTLNSGVTYTINITLKNFFFFTFNDITLSENKNNEDISLSILLGHFKKAQQCKP